MYKAIDGTQHDKYYQGTEHMISPLIRLVSLTQITPSVNLFDMQS